MEKEIGGEDSKNVVVKVRRVHLFFVGHCKRQQRGLDFGFEAGTSEGGLAEICRTGATKEERIAVSGVLCNKTRVK